MSFAFDHQGKIRKSKTDLLAKHSSQQHHTNHFNKGSVGHLFHLQRTIGNQAVQRLMSSNKDVREFDFPRLGIQPSLKISQPGDAYEQEADRVAEEVMKMLSSSVHPNSAQSMETAKEEGINRKCAACEMKQKEDAKQLNISRMSSTSPNLQADDEIAKEVANIHSSTGTSFDSSVRESMGSSFGYDFNNVRIHTDERAARSADSVNAVAYTVGNDIVFGDGRYQPNTAEGKRLLAHELAHVVQQGEAPIRMNKPLRFNSPPSDAPREGDPLTKSIFQGSQSNSMTVSRVPKQVLQREVLRPLASGAPIFDQVIDADRIIDSIINISRFHPLTRGLNWRAHPVGELIKRVAGGRYFRGTNFWSSGWVDDEWPDYWTLGLTDVDIKVDLTLLVADIETQTQGGGTFSSSGKTTETLTQNESTTASGSGEVSAGGHEGKPGGKAGAGVSHTTASGRTLEDTGESGLSISLPTVVYRATAVMRIMVHFNPTLESIFTKTTDVNVGHVVFGAPATTPP